ncbi:MAG: hypothetical protein EP319_08475 [Deltaproteobacteria bacterium]|nr:MAG: hypothetical protein EP319_08475 [Deltaproteobacteria bacterium]
MSNLSKVKASVATFNDNTLKGKVVLHYPHNFAGQVKNINKNSFKGFRPKVEEIVWCELDQDENVLKITPYDHEKVNEDVEHENVHSFPIKNAEELKSLTHVITVFHPSACLENDIVRLHMEKLHELNGGRGKSNSIFWGKLVEKTKKRTPGITTEWVQNLNEIIEKNGQDATKLIITDFKDVYMAPLIRVHYNDELSKRSDFYNKMPDYYQSLLKDQPCEVFFEINDLYKMRRESLFGSLIVKSNKQEYSPYESGLTYPLLVKDDAKIFSSSELFSPSHIKNNYGAQFYDLFNFRFRDQAIIEDMILNLIDECAWREVPEVAKINIIEAEEAYRNAYLRHCSGEVIDVRMHKLALRYFQVIEAFLKENVKHKITKTDIVSPYHQWCNLMFDKHPASILFDEFFSFLENMDRKKAEMYFKECNFYDFQNYLKSKYFKQIKSFTKTLRSFRNFDSHVKTDDVGSVEYKFEDIKILRDRFWGIASLDRILKPELGIGYFNIIMRLYMFYAGKFESMNSENAESSSN